MIRIFTDNKGLRSGWRFLLYALAVFLLVWVSQIVLRALLGHRTPVETPIRLIASEIVLLVAAMLPAWVASRLEERRWRTYGLPLQPEGALFATGLFAGFAAISLLMLLIHLFHGVYLGNVVLHGTALLRYALVWGVRSCWSASPKNSSSAAIRSTPWRRESVSGQPQFCFRRSSALSIYETLAKTGSALWVRSPSRWFSLSACGAQAASGSRSACTHLWDWAESFFYGVPDSGYKAAGTLFTPRFAGSKWITGGSVGPEGSVLAFVIVIAMALTIHLLYPKRQWRAD